MSIVIHVIRYMDYAVIRGEGLAWLYACWQNLRVQTPESVTRAMGAA